MSKMPCVTTLMGSHNVKGSETLFKSASQQFSQIIWLLRKKISSKIYFLVVPEILRLFLNILTPDNKYSLSVKVSV